MYVDSFRNFPQNCNWLELGYNAMDSSRLGAPFLITEFLRYFF